MSEINLGSAISLPSCEWKQKQNKQTGKQMNEQCTPGMANLFNQFCQLYLTKVIPGRSD